MKLSNFVRRAAFALRFGSLDPLISGQINSEHQAAHGARHPRPGHRSWRRSSSSTPTRTRSCSATGRVWVIDGYTTTDHVPVLAVARRREGSLTRSFNYVRNSVKVDRRRLRGHGHLLRVRQEGPDHPGLARRRSPTSSPTGRSMPEALREHLRYPEDLFKVAGRTCSVATTSPSRKPLLRRQREVAGVARPRLGSRVERHRLSRALIATPASAAEPSSNQPQAATSTGARIDPYYLNIRAARTQTPSTSSSPCRSCRCRRATARRASCRSSPPNSDPGQYGELRSFTMPQGQTVEGPVQVNNEIIRTSAISHRDHAAQPAGLAGHPGQHAADPGRQLDRSTCGRSTRRAAGSGSYPLFQFVVGVHARATAPYCGPTVQDGLDQMLGRRQPVTACNVSARDHPAAPAPTRRPRPPPPRRARPRPRRPPTTTTIPPATGIGAGPAQPGGRPSSTRPQPALERRRPRRLPDARSKQARDAGRSRPRQLAGWRSSPGTVAVRDWGSPPGLLLWA